MAKIERDSQPTQDRIDDLGVTSWPIWTKEVSTFPWTYDEPETCYFLAEEVVVTCADGTRVEMGKGDLVTFPAGLSCTWEVKQPVRKHFRFGE